MRARGPAGPPAWNRIDPHASNLSGNVPGATLDDPERSEVLATIISQVALSGIALWEALRAFGYRDV
jgi:hypothetical protein